MFLVSCICKLVVCTFLPFLYLNKLKTMFYAVLKESAYFGNFTEILRINHLNIIFSLTVSFNKSEFIFFTSMQLDCLL